jgi:uncharacterized iron-regulated membrane protein
MNSETQDSSKRAASALYRTLWRWHFWSGLLCAPIAVMLAVTGAIYLWKPQYESWRYRDLLTVLVPTAGALTSTPDALLAAARAAVPEDWRAQSFTPAFAPDASAQVTFRPHSAHSAHAGHQDRATVTVFVDPYTNRVLGQRDDARTLMAVVKKIHGSLFLGDLGELLVELAASWCFVLLATGFYLWWPRPFSVRGFLLPRFGAGRRALFRDLHAVPAVWFSAAILFLLATGIPWANTGGKWFATLAKAIGEWQPRETAASAHRSELLGGWSPYVADKMIAEKLERVASAPPISTSNVQPESLTLARVMAIAAERCVLDAYTIALPQSAAGVFSVLSDRNRAFTRTYLHLDRYSGVVLADVRFAQFGLLAKFFSFGIIAHEGQLFGLANQLLGFAACLGFLLIVGSGVAMWWTSRPASYFTPSFQLTRPIITLILVLAFLLPLLAASLALLYLGEYLIKRLVLEKISNRMSKKPWAKFH